MQEQVQLDDGTWMDRSRWEATGQPKTLPKAERESWPQMPGQAEEVGSHKNSAAPSPLRMLYLALAALAGSFGIISGMDAPFFVALGFLGLAELVILRQAWEVCGERARRRMAYPPTRPPLRDGASQEERALAWAAIACRASELGDYQRADRAWKASDAALRSAGGSIQ